MELPPKGAGDPVANWLERKLLFEGSVSCLH